MNTNRCITSPSFWLGLLLLCCSANPLRADQFGLFTYQVIGGTQVTITDYPKNAVGAVTIPAQIAGLPVTSIGNQAFELCTGLTSVTIPASVTSIGDYTFSDCTGLTSVTIPASITSIGDLAFAGCTGLTSVTLQPGLVALGANTFSRCTGLTSVTIPASVTTIGDLAFAGCTGLTSVTIPASVTSIGDYTFSGCIGLTSVTIPASITSIGNYAFGFCTGLTSVTLQPGLVALGSNMFYGCTGLTSVIVPASVTYIGNYAFRNCTGLTSVTIPASVTSIGNSAFGGCTGLKSAVFQSNAPANFGSGVFEDTAPGFTVYYFTNWTGFTSPVWVQGYPSIGIDPAVWPAATWLLAHGLAYDTNLQLDPDGDGVSLLLAYALNLDPRQNLPSRLPAPVLGEDYLSISFYAGTPGITYHVETSTDLQTWTTTGVTQSDPGADGRSTATVNRDAPTRSLRLLVED